MKKKTEKRNKKNAGKKRREKGKSISVQSDINDFTFLNTLLLLQNIATDSCCLFQTQIMT